MPKKVVFPKEAIIEKAFEIFKEEGIDSITARNVAKALNSSPAPIYSSVGSMDLLKEELVNRAKKLFMDYITTVRTGIMFLDIGMGVAIFAREERKLFSNIFLIESVERALMNEFLDLVHDEAKKDKRFSCLTEEQRNELFLNCWIFANGLSTLIATGFIPNPSDEYIKEKLMSNPAKLLYEYLDKHCKV
ncbi:MAG: TetR/AcrR family transcriptional regulator [Fusobacterium sp.]|uniref:TetR/AcrR family transcriptional regulator n=1 Tax=Fusobacterium sp. TaxID=68766 RepID=UPI0026DD58AE|nr:TetR/AcrR family transcriptional regulator [Fusobacterium sp.]MDO4690313.1 TetR/AcrR family transcriptional regulator [Fusobacterium sp.]